MPSPLELTVISHVVAITILYYDYLLTFSKEVDFFWARPHGSWAFALFVANRYIALLGHVPAMVAVIWPLPRGEQGVVRPWAPGVDLELIIPSCKSLATCERIVTVIVQLIGGAVMIMRVYALYGKSIRVLLFLLSCALAGGVVGCWAVLPPSSPTSPLVSTPAQSFGCNIPITVEQTQRMAIAWSCQAAFDVVVFILTLWRTLYIKKAGNRALLHVLIHDGVLYFGVITVVNIANISAFLVFDTSSGKSIFAAFTNIIAATMISRLMLNLRDPKILSRSRLATPANDDTLLITTILPETIIR